MRKLSEIHLGVSHELLDCGYPSGPRFACDGFFADRSHFLVDLANLVNFSQRQVTLFLSGTRLTPDHRATDSTDLPWWRAFPIVGENLDGQEAHQTRMKWSPSSTCSVHPRLICCVIIWRSGLKWRIEPSRSCECSPPRPWAPPQQSLRVLRSILRQFFSIFVLYRCC